MNTRIIGCGNLHRMDDGAGVMAAQRLREMGVPAETQSGGAFELIADWERDQHVVLIDAVVTGAPPGSIHVWEGNPPRLPHSQQFSSHGFGLAEAFRLGKVLDWLPDRITVYGIEGAQFDMGERVSPEVLSSVEEVAKQIAERFTPELQEQDSAQIVARV